MVTITADFTARSSEAPITEMRTLNHCGSLQAIESVAWEPFTMRKEYSFRIAISNWIGWYLAVQYRDAAGNVSPIYCDDISIEGMPSP